MYGMPEFKAPVDKFSCGVPKTADNRPEEHLKITGAAAAQ
jgi:hypothetical protein